ncbi:MAG TPA: hypothetical protein VFV10_03375 [Gammaproteobacteria bacterium]|nr:hypothetical protein [Gammaproteobacteria bacterium]
MADTGLAPATPLPEVFLLEVLFLLDARLGFAAFLRVTELAFFGAVFLDDRFATFLRPDAGDRLALFFREDPPAAFLLLPGLLFFLAAACLAGIRLASKRYYKKPAIIHTGARSGSL